MIKPFGLGKVGACSGVRVVASEGDNREGVESKKWGGGDFNFKLATTLQPEMSKLPGVGLSWRQEQFLLRKLLM